MKVGPFRIVVDNRLAPNEAYITQSAEPEMADTKDTNPKDAVGTAKVPVSTLSFQVMAEVGVAMLEGARKYGRHNYRVSGVRASVYFDAVFRHLGAWWEGEDLDPESGLSHVTKAIAGLMVLRDSMMQGNWVDDRPPRAVGAFVKRLNEVTAAIIERTPDPKPAHTAAAEAHGNAEAKEFARAVVESYLQPGDPSCRWWKEPR